MFKMIELVSLVQVSPDAMTEFALTENKKETKFGAFMQSLVHNEKVENKKRNIICYINGYPKDKAALKEYMKIYEERQKKRALLRA